MLPLPAGCELVRELGAGSVFEVALVRRDGVEAVCKRLRASLAGNPVARAAMAREMGALERLAGRHAPRLLASGGDAAGPFWLQARADGPSLGDTVAGYGDPLPGEVVGDWLRFGFETLAAVHAQGVVHGDINPDHVLSHTLIDFGLARWPGIGAALIGEGERGTLPYVAPEVVRGEVPPDEVNDVFALAATIAFAALGREPCRTSGVARLTEIAERGVDLEALTAAALPAAVALALSRALAFERRERATSAASVLAML